MKILHIAEQGSGGGAESVFRESVMLLKEHDQANIHFVACKSATNLPFNIDYVFSGKISKTQLIYSFRYKIELEKILSHAKPDIVHLHHTGLLSSSILHVLWKYKRVNPRFSVVQTAHTFEYICSHHAAYDYNKSIRCLDCLQQRYKFKIFYRNCSRSGYFHSVAKGISSLISHFFYKRRVVDIIIVPSEFMKSTISASKLHDQDRIVVLDNPVSKGFLRQNILNEKKNQIIYFGRLSEEKNIQLVLKAFALYVKANHNPYNLLIIGEGPEADKLKALAIKLNLKSLVAFMPFMPHSELKNYLGTSKISILASKCYENAPMMVLESLAFNIIPIVCNHGGMKEMVNKFNFGVLFDSDSVDSLSLNISEVIRNYDKLLEGSILARNLAQTYLAKDNYVKKLSEIYSGIY